MNPPNEPDSLNPPKPDAQARRFDDFWKAYPRKEGKAQALKSWKRQKLDSIADEIIADVKARLEDPGQWKGKGKQYLPHGSTFVYQRRWEDEWSPSADPAALPRETDEDLKAAQAKAERKAATWTS
ncbi:MAG: hypothetical protein U5L08_02695 [Xanthomonadales bacterium]|nr:hypothetical protein [Xanthomonadales bacterium]